jgi:hypothetical protein
VIDIIGLADAFLNIAEIREAGDHIADRDAGHRRMGLIAIEREIGSDDRDAVFLLVVGVDLDESDVGIGVELR